MKHLLIILSCLLPSLCSAQTFSGEYTAEWQWDMKRNTNWLNLLRLNLNVPVFDGKGTIEASTLHIAKTNETIIADWQTFSNIEAENNVAAIAVLGYMHEWQAAHLFVGVRNVNEDFFTSDITALFINSSCGIFPTIAANYPIANYPFSGLTVYFDVSRGGWTFRNSLYNGTGYNGWKRRDNPFLVRPAKDGVSTSRNWSMRTAVRTTSPAWLSTRGNIPSARMAKCRLPTLLHTRPPAPGGRMPSSPCGRLPTTA